MARAEEAPPPARALWIGLAAEAAFAGGDELGTVRYLKMAYELAVEGFGPEMSAREIREKASPTLHEGLDRVGVPRFE